MTGAGPDLSSLFCEALDRPTALEQANILTWRERGRKRLNARVKRNFARQHTPEKSGK
jgi:hypothetical protein